MAFQGMTDINLKKTREKLLISRAESIFGLFKKIFTLEVPAARLELSNDRPWKSGGAGRERFVRKNETSK